MFFLQPQICARSQDPDVEDRNMKRSLGCSDSQEAVAKTGWAEFSVVPATQSTERTMQVGENCGSRLIGLDVRRTCLQTNFKNIV